MTLKWSVSQNSTARIADFEQKREDLYYPYKEEMVDEALLAVASALETDVTKSNLVYDKDWFFTIQWLKAVYYGPYYMTHTLWSLTFMVSYLMVSYRYD